MTVSAVVFAYNDVGVRCLQVLLAAGVDIQAVVTHRDDPGEIQHFASVAELAAEHDLLTLYDEDAEGSAFAGTIQALGPDFIFSFYYRKMLPEAVLGAAVRGAFNMHGSLLPAFRGRAPINWAIVHGATETGASLHVMTAKPDRGAVIDQMAVPILPDDTAGDVLKKVTVAAELVLGRALPGLMAGTESRRDQDDRLASYFGRRTPDDGRIDLQWPAYQIHNLIRAVAPPYPGAFIDTPGGRMQVARSQVSPQDDPRIPAEPGIHKLNGRLYLRCGDRKLLRILASQPGAETWKP